MTVAFFETTNASPHFETALELAERHAILGDQVQFYFVGNSIPYSEFVTKQSTVIFRFCLPEEAAARVVKQTNIRFILKPSIRPVPSSILFSSLDQLKSYRYKSYSAGMSAASSFISHLGMSSPNTIEHASLLESILSSGVSLYEYVVSTLISNPDIDLVYVFNGRFANNRAIIDACRTVNIRYLVHERGADKDRFSRRSFTPHNIDLVKVEMKNSNYDIRGSLVWLTKAESFFKMRRVGTPGDWVSFTSKQIPGLLCEIPKNKKIISYFSSSEDEFLATEDLVRWERWPSQLKAFADLLDLVSRDLSLFIVIRLHPHLVKKHKSSLLEWTGLDYPKNSILVLPQDPVDTYALIERSDIVVTCGSVVGIESVYWGTPSICLGPTNYDNLGAVYLPNNKEELAKLLSENNLAADKSKALIYGYYYATFGERFMFYNADTLFSGRYRGVNLQGKEVCKFCRLISRLILGFMRRFREALKNFHDYRT